MSSSVGRNSFIMATGTAASRITGQIRTIMLAAAVGTTGMAANAYQAGSMIPQVIYTLISGGIFNAVLVPQIVRTLKEDDAQERLNKIFTFAVMLLLGMTVLIAALTPVLVRLYVNGSSDLVGLTFAFTLWCTPQIFFYGIYTVLGQILAAKNRFATYAWSSVGANVISCIGFGIFIALFGNGAKRPLSFWTADKLTLTAGMWTLGVAFQALVLFIPLLKMGMRFRLKFGVHGIGLRSMGSVAGWSLGIVGIDQVANILCTRVTTSAPLAAEQRMGLDQYIVAGNATYQNAYTIYLLPYSLIAVSVATAIFPKISAAIANHNIDEVRSDLSSSLRNVGLIMCFFTSVFMVIPLVIIRSLLPTVPITQATLICGPLMALSIGLPATSAYLIIQRTFYAFEDGRHPFIFMVLFNILQVGIMYLGVFTLPPTQWVNAMALSGSLGYLISFVPLVFMLRKRFDGRMDGRRIALTYLKAIAAMVVTGVIGLALRPLVYRILDIENPARLGMTAWIQDVVAAAVLGIVMLVVYVGCLWVMRTQEMTSIVVSLKNRFFSSKAAQDTDAIDEPLNEVAEAQPAIPMELAQGNPVDAFAQASPEETVLSSKPLVPRQPTQTAVSPSGSVQASGHQVDIPLPEPGEETVLSSKPLVPSFPPSNKDGLPREVESAQVGLPPTTGTDRIATVTTEAAGNQMPAQQTSHNSMGVDEQSRPHAARGHDRAEEHTSMKPHLGDTVLNRYALISPLREQSGMQVWKASDRVLARDCQLFIVSNTELLPSTNAIAGALATSRDPRFTSVIQLQHVNDVAIVITYLDSGISLNQYLQTPAPLSHEAMRTIIAQSGKAVKALQTQGLTHHSVSPYTIRLTKSDVQLADAPVSVALADCSNVQAGDSEERIAVRQLAASLYCMLTRTPAKPGMQFSLDALPEGTPGEFYVICKRGLGLSDGKQPTIPMLTIAELEALLGNYRPLHALSKQDVRISSPDGECTITDVPLKPVNESSVLPLPPNLVSNQPLPSLPYVPLPEPSPMDYYLDEDDENGSNPEKPGEKTQTINANSFRTLWNESKAIIGGKDQTDQTPEIQPEDATEMFTAFDENAEPPMQPNRLTVPIRVSSMRDPNVDDATAVESTGQIPLLDHYGRPVQQQTPSQRAARREEAVNQTEYNQESITLPPSFVPNENPNYSDTKVEDKDKKDRHTGRKIGIIALVVVLAVALGFAIRSIATTGSLFGDSGQHQNWPSFNVDDVPFGSSKGKEVPEKEDSNPTAEPTPTKTEEPVNNDPYQVASQRFLNRPDGQQGFGYYIQLSKKEHVSRVVLKIRTSGGHGFIRVNTPGNPTQGDQAAEFTFAEGGTTEIKFNHPVDTQDVMLWVPIDSLPGGQLYIDSMQVF